VFTVVLNQIDTLPPQQARDCEEDLQRLLDAEGLHDAPLLPVSARTGAGLGELRDLLAETVTNNRAVGMRIAADIDAMIGGFAVYAGPQVVPGAESADGALPLAAPLPAALAPTEGEPAESALPPWELEGGEQDIAIGGPVTARPPWADATPDGEPDDKADPAASVPRGPAEELAGAFARAAGVAAVAQAMAGVREAQAARLTGWPAGRLLGRRRDPLRALRAAGSAGAARQAIDAAVGQAQQWWAATSPSRGRAASARRPGPAPGGSRRRWPTPCASRSRAGRGHRAGGGLSPPGSGC
jgi:hypothetical protein